MVTGRYGQEGASVLTASGDGRPRSGALLNGASVLTASDDGRPRSGSLRSLIVVPSEERASDVSAGGPAPRPVSSRELGRSAYPTKPSGAAMVTGRYGQESTEIGGQRKSECCYATDTRAICFDATARQRGGPRSAPKGVLPERDPVSVGATTLDVDKLVSDYPGVAASLYSWPPIFPGLRRQVWHWSSLGLRRSWLAHAMPNLSFEN